MKTFFLRVLATQSSGTTLLIRILVGSVFLSEGIQKFLYPAYLGAGRFERIGIPLPEIMGPFVGTVEIIAGIAILAGVMIRFAALTLFFTMVVAIVSTKIPILIGQDYWIFQVRELSRYGFWSMAHESRTDFSMLIGTVFLMISGAGPWSLDSHIVSIDAPCQITGAPKGQHHDSARSLTENGEIQHAGSTQA